MIGTLHAEAGKGSYVMLSKVNVSSSLEGGIHVYFR
jgi:hypothetical protein